MANFNSSNILQEPISHDEFEKAVDSIGLLVFSEEAIQRFDADVEALIKKGQASALTQEEADMLEKAMRDRSHLVKKVVTRKDGRKTTKWVRPAEAGKAEGGKKAEESGASGASKTVEQHAAATSDKKLAEYAKNGKDEDLKKIAQMELKKRDGDKADVDKVREASKHMSAEDHKKESEKYKKERAGAVVTSHQEHAANMAGIHDDLYREKKSKDGDADGLNLSKDDITLIGNAGDMADFNKMRKTALKNGDDLSPQDYYDKKKGIKKTGDHGQASFKKVDHSLAIHTDAARIAKEAGLSKKEFDSLHPRTKIELSERHLPSDKGASNSYKVGQPISLGGIDYKISGIDSEGVTLTKVGRDVASRAIIFKRLDRLLAEEAEKASGNKNGGSDKIKSDIKDAQVGATASGGGYDGYKKIKSDTWENTKTKDLKTGDALFSEIGSFKDFKISGGKADGKKEEPKVNSVAKTFDSFKDKYFDEGKFDVPKDKDKKADDYFNNMYERWGEDNEVNMEDGYSDSEHEEAEFYALTAVYNKYGKNKSDKDKAEKGYSPDLIKALSSLGIDQSDDLFEKARDRSHLVKKTITRKDGRVTTKWVNPNQKEVSTHKKGDKVNTEDDKHGSVGQTVSMTDGKTGKIIREFRTSGDKSRRMLTVKWADGTTSSVTPSDVTIGVVGYISGKYSGKAEIAVTIRDLKKHSQYTKSDYDYLKSKEWTDKEIKERWDEEKSRNVPPLNHRPPVDVVGYISGKYSGKAEKGYDPDLLKAFSDLGVAVSKAHTADSPLTTQDLEGKLYCLPDGTFNITNKEELSNAIHAVDLASDIKLAKSHIRTRATALGLVSSLPKDWN